MMKAPIVIVGIGELGGVFAHGFLRSGYPVYPVTRRMDMEAQSKLLPEPALVLVAVQEDELHPVLDKIPTPWLNKVGLLQNELLPHDWQRHPLVEPTIAVVWFEKKKSMVLTNILYTSVYGPGAKLMEQALVQENIPVHFPKNEAELLYELVRKSLYILTVNVAGLVENCSVIELWHDNQALALELAHEAIVIQQYLTGETLPEQKLIQGMVEGIEDCPNRKCKGRRAFQRLQRCIEYADKGGLHIPKMREIYRNVSA